MLNDEEIKEIADDLIPLDLKVLRDKGGEGVLFQSDEKHLIQESILFLTEAELLNKRGMITALGKQVLEYLQKLKKEPKS
jgi:hypothetical protein